MDNQQNQQQYNSSLDSQINMQSSIIESNNMDENNIENPIISELEEKNYLLKDLCHSFIAQNDNLYSQIELQYKFIVKQNQELNSMKGYIAYLNNHSDELIEYYKEKAENNEDKVKNMIEIMDQYIQTSERVHISLLNKQ